MSDEKFDRVFKGVWLPAVIWEATDITWTQKCLLAEIDSLDGGDGCFASNEYLAKMFQSSPASIANQISDLRSKLYIQDRGFDGRRRRISINPAVKAGLTGEFTLHSLRGESCHNPAVNIDTRAGTRSVPSLVNPPPPSVKKAARKSVKDRAAAPFVLSRDTFIEMDGEGTCVEVVMVEWNKLPKSFPKIREMTLERQEQLLRMLRNDLWLNGWREALRLAPNVPFLRGEGKPRNPGEEPWVMTFDWFIKKPDHIVKIIEGTYGRGDRTVRAVKTVPLRENEVPRVANVDEELARLGIA